MEVRIKGQGDPWAQRVCADGEVWGCTSIDTRIEGGQVVQGRRPLEWRHETRLDPERVEAIEAVLRRGAFDLPAEIRPSRETSDTHLVTWRMRLDGKEHSVRLMGMGSERVPLLADLDRAVKLGIAMALDRDAEGG